LTGCNPQTNPAGAGGRPAGLTQKEIDERHAANFLNAAKDFQDDGHPKYAVDTLKELLEQFPDSEAAVEARQMLTELEPLANEPEAESETQE
jgi:outer membrane protein assembly factor BamD (BamD/ComL family)